MAMDFFQSQDNARRRTGMLVFLFVFGLIATTVGTASVGYLAGAVFDLQIDSDSSGSSGRRASSTTSPGTGAINGMTIGLITAASTLTIIAVASLVKLEQMGRNGCAVAESFGGVALDSADIPEAQQVRNVVEEMAIASGLPVPPVYILADDSINAFAAGLSPSDAAIGVTRGACTKLTRDELQGVMGHEFSHIFHGDMKINARTTAAIFGMMVVGVCGYILFRFVGPTILRVASGGKKNPAPAIALVIIAVGLLIWAIGSVGTFFGRLIQAAVSREREFLADASSVQYTRNPDGLASALRKIGGCGSAVTSQSANECAHFYFAPALSTMFATHPPLEERIRRIEALPAGVQVPVSGVAAPIGAATASLSPGVAMGAVMGMTPLAAGVVAGVVAGVAGVAGAPATSTLGGVVVAKQRLTEAAARVGSPSMDAIASARRKLDSVDNTIAKAVRSRAGAMAAVLIVAQSQGAPGSHEGKSVAAKLGDGVGDEFDRLCDLLSACKVETKLVVLDLCAPTLSTLTNDKAKTFVAAVNGLIGSDGRISLGEWTVRTFVRTHVLARFETPPRERGLELSSLIPEATLVLGSLAGASQGGQLAAAGLAAASRRLGLGDLKHLSTSVVTTKDLDAALSKLRCISGAKKRTFVAACIDAVSPDDVCSVSEALILRAVCDSIGVPLLDCSP
ncbi:MAG: hypothetical protein EXS00_03550 [Phycisphaerales bacterium]|nr:hypothetical protein [Phycisphaerales bacterium]